MAAHILIQISVAEALLSYVHLKNIAAAL